MCSTQRVYTRVYARLATNAIFEWVTAHCVTLMRESDVEAMLVKAAARAGGLAAKHVSPGRAGDPDRLVVIPRPECPQCGSKAVVALVEVKRPGERPRPLQTRRMEEWASKGLRVAWVSTPDEVQEMVRGMLS